MNGRYDRDEMSAPDRDTLGGLLTEARHHASERLDELSTAEMPGADQCGGRERLRARCKAELGNVARAVDAIAERFGRGGRLFYVGAGDEWKALGCWMPVSVRRRFL